MVINYSEMTQADLDRDVRFFATNSGASYHEAYCIETGEVVFRGFDFRLAIQAISTASDGTHARDCSGVGVPGYRVDPYTGFHYGIRIESTEDRIARIMCNSRPVHTSKWYRQHCGRETT